MRFPRIVGLVSLVSMLSWASASVRAQSPTESWPQKFEILQGDHSTFGFALTQPGPISVVVQSQGAPINVTLHGPLTQNVGQTGTGTLHLSYTATQADVQRSALWLVYIAAQNNAGLFPSARPQVLASGLISIQHPPAVPAVVQAQLRLLQAQYKQKVQGALTASQSAQAQALQARNARMQGVSVSTAAHLATPIVSIRPGITPSTPIIPIRPGIIPLTVTSPGSGTSTAPPVNAYNAINSTPASSALTIALTGVGNPNFSDTAPYEPQWCSAGSCIAIAQPNDWVELSGPIQTSDEVHVIINPTTDIILPTYSDSPSYQQGINWWAGGAIPSITSPFQGWIYLKRAGQHGNLLPVLVEPPSDSVQIGVFSEQFQIASTNSDLGFGVSTSANGTGQGEYVERDGGSVAGSKGDDYFFENQPLNNGWFVASVGIAASADEGSGGGAYVTAGGPGTGNTQVTVHWWVDAMGYSSYTLSSITLMGPKGTSYK